MTRLLTSATGKYLIEPAPEHLYQDTIEWLSEIEFFKTELAFLSKLMDRAFLRITTSQKRTEFNRLASKVKLFTEVVIIQIYDELNIHERHLSALDLDVFSHSRAAIHEEHNAKYAHMKSFREDIKSLKKEIFSLVEKQLKTAKKITGDFEDGNLAL